MKLICSKSNLLRGVNIVSKAVPTRTTMAILECILIDASTNEIKLMANDMELGIETRVEGEIADKMFRQMYEASPKNISGMFRVGSARWNSSADAAMHMAEGDLAATLTG